MTGREMLSRFNLNYFFAIPPETQTVWFWFGFFVLLLVASFVIYFVLRAKGAKARPYKRYAKNFFWPNIALAIFGLVFSFSRYEKLALLSYRFWVYVTILLVIVYNGWYFTLKRSKLEDELLKFHNTKRKEKWLSLSNNTKHKTKK